MNSQILIRYVALEILLTTDNEQTFTACYHFLTDINTKRKLTSLFAGVNRERRDYVIKKPTAYN